MVKNLLFAVLLLTLQVHPLSVLAINGPKEVTIPTDACTAPPPDSFRVTTIGYNFVTVAWNPSALVENYRLTVFKKNQTNDWDSLYSVNLVNTTTYTIDDLEPNEEYLAGIRSVCQNGSLGDSVSYINPIHTLIIELTVGGRKPINPSPITCNHINYLDPANKWVGFSISDYSSHDTITTFFEFEKVDIIGSSTVARIKRVENSNLVTANSFNRWPTPSFPTLEAGQLFNIGKVSGNGILEDFGDVEIVLYNSPVNVDICASLTDNSYVYQTLVAKDFERCKTCPGIEPGGGLPGSSGNGGGQGNIYSNSTIKVENPFSEYIKLFSPDYGLDEEILMYLLNMRGDLIFEQRMNFTEGQILIPASYIESGIYILHIEGKGLSENIKIIKIK